MSRNWNIEVQVWNNTTSPEVLLKRHMSPSFTHNEFWAIGSSYAPYVQTDEFYVIDLCLPHKFTMGSGL